MSGTMVHHERSRTADYPSPSQESMEWHRRSWDGSTNKVIASISSLLLNTYILSTKASKVGTNKDNHRVKPFQEYLQVFGTV